jgi:hypothetical protein
MMVRVVLLVIVALSGCSSLSESGVPGLFFPRHSVRGGPMLGALIEGRLEVKDGCIWIVAQAGTRYLAIWPPGSNVRSVAGRIEITDGAGQVIAAEGETVKGSGGETVTRENARSVMGQTEPAGCRTEKFWVVAQLARGVPASATPSPTAEGESD